MPSEEGRDGNKRGGHVPFWPPRPPRKRVRKLCFLYPIGDGRYRLWWEDGKQSQPFETYIEWKALLSAQEISVDCFVGELQVDGTGFPWIHHAIRDKQAKVNCSKNGGVSSLQVRCGKYTLAVGALYFWDPNWSKKSPLDVLSSIRAIGEWTRTGQSLSPGACGTNVLLRMWTQLGNSYAKVSRCNLRLLQKLKEFAIAGRVETFTDRRVMHSIELDMRSAYASCAGSIPWGTPRRIPSRRSPSEASEKYATWFCECTVTIVTELDISPIPIKVRGRWTWATQPGIYKTWMWREEVEACIRTGVIVEVEEGWGWKRLSNRLRPWVEEMERYRSHFESIGRLDIAAMVKRCTVSAIGWLGCYLIRYQLSAYYQKGNLPLVDKKGAAPISNYSLHPTEDMSSGSPNHLHTYILMRCRLKVYERELEEKWDGNELLSVNFDAIFVMRPSRLPTGRGLGEWKQEPRVARNEEGLFPHARWLNDKRKVTLPGLPRNSPLRQKYMRQRTSASSAEPLRYTGAAVDATDLSVSVAALGDTVLPAP